MIFQYTLLSGGLKLYDFEVLTSWLKVFRIFSEFRIYPSKASHKILNSVHSHG